jgi:hypothetical protein
VTQWVGYPHPHWLIVASTSLRGAIHGDLVTGVSFVAAYLTCLVGFKPKVEPFAGVLFLLAVEAAGTGAAILTGVFVVMMISLYGVYDAFRNRPAGGSTWPYVAKDTVVNILLVVWAAPIYCGAALAASFKLLSDGWLRPDWLDGGGAVD